MNKIAFQILLQWKLDLRNKSVLLPYYIVPIVFYLVMGSVFSSIMPNMEDTLLQAMIIFSVVMGSSLGQPTPLSEIYGTDVKKAYKLGNIPSYVPILINFISGIIHITMVSLIIFITAPLLFHTAIPANMGVFLLSYFVFLFACLGVGTFIGTHFYSASSLVLAGQVIFLPSIMLSGIMFPVTLLPGFLQKIAYIFPATLGNIVLTSSQVDVVILSALFGIFLLMMILAIRKTRNVY